MLRTFCKLNVLFIMVSSVYGQLAANVGAGACPDLVGSLKDRQNEPFTPEKLLGLWRAVFEGKSRTKGLACPSIKFKAFEEGESHQFRVLVGNKIISADGDFTGGKLFANGTGGFYYDDNNYFTFGHPNKTTVAAV